MNCRRIVNMMSAYVDGELTGEEMLAIRRHMHECAECREEYESIRFTKMAVASLRSTAPRPDLANMILRQLDEVETPQYQRFAGWLSGFIHGKLSPVAAALATAGVALVILTAGGTDKLPTNSNEVAVAQVQIQNSDAKFLNELRSDSISISSSEPLKLANDRPTYGGATMEFASLSTR